MRAFRPYVLLAMTALCFAPARASLPPVSIEDLPRIADVEEPAISPDGRRIAIVVIRGDDHALYIVERTDGHLTLVAQGGDAAVPRWSPDGKQLAYLRQDAAGKAQIVLWDGAAAKVATHFPGGVVDFAWSPDGTRIAAGVAESQPAPPYFYAGDNEYSLQAPAPPEHLWILAADGSHARRLTSGSWTVAPTDAGGIFTPQFAWSNDAKTIVFARLPNTRAGDNEYSTLWQADTATGALRKLTARSAFELSPVFAPAGTSWLYSYPRGGNYLAQNTIRLVLGAKTTEITARFDRDAGGALWMPDGRSILVCANDRTSVGAWLFDLGGNFRRLHLGGLDIACDAYQDSEYDSGVAATAARNGALAFVATDAHHARELYYGASVFAAPRRLTHFNDWVSQRALGTQRRISWRSPDGFTDYGVVTLPPGARPGKRYPIVVEIHGGPGASSIIGFDPAPGWPRAQLIASHGYVVFEPNYRGSDDAGNAFLLAVIGNTVRGPAADIMSGLKTVEALPQADRTREAVCGWSYGGLMTSWLITQYHNWRAAVTGASVENELEEYALSVSNVQDRYYQRTSPFSPRGLEQYRRNSPLSYAAQVTTPTLIWSTTGDTVVPITQSYEFFHALSERGVPVKFAVFPGSTHRPSTEAQTQTLTRLWLGWLDKYLQDGASKR